MQEDQENTPVGKGSNPKTPATIKVKKFKVDDEDSTPRQHNLSVSTTPVPAVSPFCPQKQVVRD